MSRGTLPALTRALAVAGACAALAGVASMTDRTITLGGTSAGVSVSRVALESTMLTCPGPELTGVRGVEDIASRPIVVAGTAPAAVARAAGVRPAGRPLLDIAALGASDGAASDDAGKTGDGVGGGDPEGDETDDRPGARSGVATGDIAWRVRGGGALAVTAAGARAPGLTAAQETLIDDAAAVRMGVRGLVGAACADPVPDAWLLAGGGQTGRQERLILVNPGANPAVVDVAVHGRGGPIEASAGRGVSVPPRGRTAILLDALAPEESSPAVHLTSRSGLITATLAETWVDGVTPRGVDTTAPATSPSLRNVMPAVSGPGEARVRIVASSGADTIAQVRLITRAGRTPLPGDDGVQQLPAGASIDVRVPDLPADVVAVEVTSDQPAVAAVQVIRPGAKGSSDFAWSSAAPALRGPAGTPLPAHGSGQDPDRVLALVSTGGRAEADVSVVDGDGAVEVQRIAVKENSSTTLDLGSATAVWVARAGGGGALRAAVLTTSGPGGDAAEQSTAGVSIRILAPARFSARDLPVRQALP